MTESSGVCLTDAFPAQIWGSKEDRTIKIVAALCINPGVIADMHPSIITFLTQLDVPGVRAVWL